MSTKAVRTNDPGSDASVARVDMKFEIVVIPVSDVDRAKEFYGRLGWRLDADYDGGKDFRRDPGYAAGLRVFDHLRQKRHRAAPGSAQGLYLIVSDIQAARKDLLDRRIEVSEVFHDSAGVYAGTDEPYLFGRVRVSGPDAEHRSYRSFASFDDPDGNGWLLQEVTTRLQAASTLRQRTSRRRVIWPAPCVVRRRPTESTKSALVSATQIGPTGMPRTWLRSSPVRNCRSND